MSCNRSQCSCLELRETTLPFFLIFFFTLVFYHTVLSGYYYISLVGTTYLLLFFSYVDSLYQCIYFFFFVFELIHVLYHEYFGVMILMVK